MDWITFKIVGSGCFVDDRRSGLVSACGPKFDSRPRQLNVCFDYGCVYVCVSDCAWPVFGDKRNSIGEKE